jgi:hypothetical protein
MSAYVHGYNFSIFRLDTVVDCMFVKDNIPYGEQHKYSGFLVTADCPYLELCFFELMTKGVRVLQRR